MNDFKRIEYYELEQSRDVLSTILHKIENFRGYAEHQSTASHSVDHGTRISFQAQSTCSIFADLLKHIYISSEELSCAVKMITEELSSRRNDTKVGPR